MMRLPRFRYVGPRDLATAFSVLADEGPDAQVVAGGTDLFPNMKRRQQTPKVVVGLRRIEALKRASVDGTAVLGANRTLTELVEDRRLLAAYPALQKAAFAVSTPHLRNMGTIGGNLCLDTRCNYYDQSFEWRKSIDFCMKKEGKICWVAPGSPRCWAVSSSDTAPALLALGASVTLASKQGERTISLDAFFHDDGIRYMNKRPDEILTAVHVPAHAGWRSTYLKCRRRGGFDFPILSVGAALKLRGKVVEEARVVLGSVGSRPLLAETGSLVGKELTDDAIEEAAERASKVAKPLDNTDLNLSWRKRVAKDYVRAALRELRGDGPQKLPTGHLPQLLATIA